MVAGNRDRNRLYDVHGDGVEKLREGLAAIGMDDSRRSAVVRLVGEVLEANGALFKLDPIRGIKDLGEILEHVTARLGSDVELSLEVRATSAEGYKRLKTALKADIDEEAWATLHATESRPFAKPSSGKIAVKVINDYGDEVVKIFEA